MVVDPGGQGDRHLHRIPGGPKLGMETATMPAGSKGQGGGPSQGRPTRTSTSRAGMSPSDIATRRAPWIVDTALAK